MFENALLTTELDVLVLLLVASLAAIALKKINFPYTVGLVVIGVGLGVLASQVEGFAFLQSIRLSHDLILFIFVPPLIFESALNLDARLLWRNIVPVLTLAGPGLLVSTGIVGGLLGWLTPLTYPQAFLFGSLISATDPVAVIALFKELGVPKQLNILVEGESLFNDATAIVVFEIILGIVELGDFEPSAAITEGAIAFVTAFAGGLLLGAIVGIVADLIIRQVLESPIVVASLSAVVAYSSFILAEEVVGVSGVITVVSAGLVLGWFKDNRLAPETRNLVDEFWEYIAFIANSLIFLLVGLKAGQFESLQSMSSDLALLPVLGIALGSILFSRAVVVFGFGVFLNLLPKIDISLKFQTISYWGGLRGAVCLALALSLSPEFPNRELIVTLTLGIAVFTLLIPGTTIGKLIQAFKLDRPSYFEVVNRLLGQIITQQNIIKKLPLLNNVKNMTPDVITAADKEAKAALAKALRDLTEIDLENIPNTDSTQQMVWLHALAIEQKQYRRLYDLGVSSTDTLDVCSLWVDMKQDQVLQGQIPPTVSPQSLVETGLGALLARLGSRTLDVEYEFCAVVRRVTAAVDEMLMALIQDINMGQAAIAKTLEDYANLEQLAAKRIDEILAENPEVGAGFNKRIAERAVVLFERETLEELEEAGVIVESTLKSLIET
ncbi:MAG: sodium:proton antiporter [Cyanobacteria bacterium P01_H01_bin.15]